MQKKKNITINNVFSKIYEKLQANINISFHLGMIIFCFDVDMKVIGFHKISFSFRPNHNNLHPMIILFLENFFFAH